MPTMLMSTRTTTPSDKSVGTTFTRLSAVCADATKTACQNKLKTLQKEYADIQRLLKIYVGGNGNLGFPTDPKEKITG